MTPQVIVENRSNTNIGNIENIVEMMKILTVANMFREQQQINILMEQLQKMEANQMQMMQELADVKQQLNAVMDKMENRSGRKDMISNISEQVNHSLAAQREFIQNVKQDLNTKAGAVTQRFRDAGIKALDNVCGFLGVKEKMIAMRDNARSAEIDMQIAVEKITAVENELDAAKAHLKTAGRITAGKEPALEKKTDEKANQNRFSPFNILKKICLKNQKKYADRVEKLDLAIKKVDSLEKRASVLDKLSDKKESLNSEKQKTAMERNIEHKREEIVL